MFHGLHSLMTQTTYQISDSLADWYKENPDDVFVGASYAHWLHSEQRSHEALDIIDRVLELDPTYRGAKYLKAVIYLSLGDYEKGWPLYIKPAGWNGETTNDPVIIYDDQGYGDFFQFARYLPLVQERCSNLIVVAKNDMLELIRDSFEDIDFQPFEHQEGRLCPITNLAYIFKTIPNTIPYLKTSCRSDIKARIGLCWDTGSRNNERYVVRVIPDHIIKPLLDRPDVIPLQKEYLKTKTFSDMAAVINNLDLVITIDTSIAHLAGALGKPVWILLSQDCDWRWGQGQLETQWYPNAKLIRQRISNDWKEVIQRIDAQLSA